MDFMPQPDEAKKFGTMKWFKWHIYKYPNIFLIAVPVPFIIYKAFEVHIRLSRELNQGTYVPNVMMNRYVVCRPTDWLAQNTPKRYTN